MPHKYTVLIKRKLENASEVFYAESPEALEKLLRREMGNDSVLKVNAGDLDPRVDNQVDFKYSSAAFADRTFDSDKDGYKDVVREYSRTQGEEKILQDVKDLSITEEEIEVIRAVFSTKGIDGTLNRDGEKAKGLPGVVVKSSDPGEAQAIQEKYNANKARYGELVALGGEYDEHQWRLDARNEAAFNTRKEDYKTFFNETNYVKVYGDMPEATFVDLWKKGYEHSSEVSISNKLARSLGVFVDAFLTLKNMSNPTTWAGLAFSALMIEFLLSAFAAPATLLAAAPVLTTLAIIGGVLVVPALLYALWALKEDFDAQITKNNAELEDWKTAAKPKAPAADGSAAAFVYDWFTEPSRSFGYSILLYCKTLPNRFREWAKKDAIHPKWVPFNLQAIVVFLGLLAGATLLVLSSLFLSGAGAGFMEPLFHLLMTTLINGLGMVIPSLDVAAPAVQIFAKVMVSLFLILGPLTAGFIFKRLGQTGNEAQLVANKVDPASIAEVEKQAATQAAREKTNMQSVVETVRAVDAKVTDLKSGQGGVDALNENVKVLDQNHRKLYKRQGSVEQYVDEKLNAIQNKSKPQNPKVQNNSNNSNNSNQDITSQGPSKELVIEKIEETLILPSQQPNPQQQDQNQSSASQTQPQPDLILNQSNSNPPGDQPPVLPKGAELFTQSSLNFNPIQQPDANQGPQQGENIIFDAKSLSTPDSPDSIIPDNSNQKPEPGKFEPVFNVDNGDLSNSLRQPGATGGLNIPQDPSQQLRTPGSTGGLG